MTNRKPLKVLWSKAAVERAGTDLISIQAKLVEEITEIISNAHSWFVHTVSDEEGDDIYLCNGRELSEHWDAYVQLAVFKPKEEPLSSQSPLLNGKTINFPRTIEESDNEIFSDFNSLDYP